MLKQLKLVGEFERHLFNILGDFLRFYKCSCVDTCIKASGFHTLSITLKIDWKIPFFHGVNIETIEIVNSLKVTSSIFRNLAHFSSFNFLRFDVSIFFNTIRKLEKWS